MIRSAFGMRSVVRIERAESFFAPRNVAKHHTHTENTGTCIAVLEGHLGAVYGCSFSPNSRFAASGSWDKTIKIWDLPKKECVLTLKGHQGRVSLISLDPISPLTCSFDNPWGCMSIPGDLSEEQWNLLADQTDPWNNFYQTQTWYLHSGVIEQADQNHHLAEKVGLQEVHRDSSQ